MIDTINDAINEEFKKRKISSFLDNVPLEEMILWSKNLSHAKRLDEDKFETYIKEVFWAVGSLHINFGYLILSHSGTSAPNGEKGVITFLQEVQSREHSLSDIHYWYHVSNCWESIYRVWERIVSVLEVRYTPKLKDSLYFIDFVMYLEENDVLTPKHIKRLKRFFSSWDKIVSKRNDITHGKFNPYQQLKIESKIAPNGQVFFEYEFPNLSDEVHRINNLCKRTFELIDLMREVCELDVEPNDNLLRVNIDR